MRQFLVAFLCVSIVGSAVPMCDEYSVSKPGPEYSGIEPEFIGYSKLYNTLASFHGLSFKNTVTIGFSTIKPKNKDVSYIGYCSYGKNFREIDVDQGYWEKASELTRRSLIFHELTHCYCTRGHDWGEDKQYPEVGTIQEKVQRAFWIFLPGVMSDGCPKSLMFPHVLGDMCAAKHWPMYEREMFDRCDPY